MRSAEEAECAREQDQDDCWSGRESTEHRRDGSRNTKDGTQQAEGPESLIHRPQHQKPPL